MTDENNPHTDELHSALRADPARWNALPLVGVQDTSLVGYVIELRNCTCGSTLGRRRKKCPKKRRTPRATRRTA